MSLIDQYDYCWYEYTNQYPCYVSVPDENGNAVSKIVLKPSEFFTGLGLPNPRNYYTDLIYDC